MCGFMGRSQPAGAPAIALPQEETAVDILFEAGARVVLQGRAALCPLALMNQTEGRMPRQPVLCGDYSISLSKLKVTFRGVCGSIGHRNLC